MLYSWTVLTDVHWARDSYHLNKPGLLRIWNVIIFKATTQNNKDAILQSCSLGKGFWFLTGLWWCHSFASFMQMCFLVKLWSNWHWHFVAFVSLWFSASSVLSGSHQVPVSVYQAMLSMSFSSQFSSFAFLCSFALSGFLNIKNKLLLYQVRA